MSQINLKSILGITSITTPAGVDDVFTIHSNDTTERFRVDQNGNQVIAGILTVTQDLNVDGHTNLDNVSIAGVTTFSHTGANQLVIKDSDTSGDNAHMRISFQDSGGTEKFFVGNNNSNGWLYIGSASGQNNNTVVRVNGQDKIQVNSNGLYVGGYIEILDTILHSGDTDTKIRFPEPNKISFETGGTERLRIDNVGVLYTGNYTTTLDSTPGSIQVNGGTAGGRLGFRGTTTSAYGGLGEMHGYWDTNKVASILFHAGSDTSNKDDGEIRFYTRTSGGSSSARLTIDSVGNLGINNSIPQKRIHISTTGNQKIVIDPNYANNSGGSSNSEANANNIVESLLIRTSYGDNAASSANAGHKWGIKFQGYNGNDFTQARSKCAGVFAVSEDTGAGYNRNVGLAFHTSQFDTAHREVMRINTNGIVTKPYQYMFTVSTTNHSKSANWSQITNHAPIAAQCTNVSDGNNWSNSTQRFTAPVAGVYHFFVGGWSYGNSNGSRYAYCFKHTNGNNYTFIGGGDYCSGDSPMAGWSRDIKLSAGEWVELWGYSAISVRWGGGHHFFWGGYLLG